MLPLPLYGGVCAIYAVMSGDIAPARRFHSSFDDLLGCRQLRPNPRLPRARALREVACSQFVADPPQKVLPPLDLGLVLDPFGRKTVHYTQDASSLFRLSKTTSVGFAVAQKIRQTSGTILIAFRTFTG